MNTKVAYALSVIVSVVLPVMAETPLPKKAYSPEEAIQFLDQARTPPQREEAKSILKSLRPEAADVLRGYINDVKKDGQKRFFVLHAMCQHLADVEQRQEFKKDFLNDPDPFFRAAIARAMGNVGDESIRQLLRESLVDKAENGLVQVSAAVGLARMGDPSGKERALKAVMEAEVWADVGILALEILQAKEAVPTLLDRANSSKDERVQYQTREAALRLQMIGKAEREQVEVLHEALSEEKSFELRQWAAIRLGEIGSKEAQKALGDVMEDPKGSGRDAARMGLMIGVEKGHWRREDVQTWLKK